MKKAVSAIILICMVFVNISAYCENVVDLINTAASELEKLSQDEAYVTALTGDSAAVKAVKTMGKGHSVPSSVFVITPDIEYMTEILSSSEETKISEEGKKALFERLISGAGALASSKIDADNSSFASLMTKTVVCNSLPLENCVYFVKYDNASPVIAGIWNDGDFCICTITIVPSSDNKAIENKEDVQDIFSDFFPRCSVEAVEYSSGG